MFFLRESGEVRREITKHIWVCGEAGGMPSCYYVKENVAFDIYVDSIHEVFQCTRGGALKEHGLGVVSLFFWPKVHQKTKKTSHNYFNVG